MCVCVCCSIISIYSIIDYVLHWLPHHNSCLSLNMECEATPNTNICKLLHRLCFLYISWSLLKAFICSDKNEKGTKGYSMV